MENIFPSVECFFCIHIFFYGMVEKQTKIPKGKYFFNNLFY